MSSTIEFHVNEVKDVELLSQQRSNAISTTADVHVCQGVTYVHTCMNVSTPDVCVYVMIEPVVWMCAHLNIREYIFLFLISIR